MTDTTKPTQHTDNTADNTGSVATGSASVPTQLPLKTIRGQKHISPAGRHSQKTHARAAARAAAQGHATEKEQHAHDRSLVVAAQNHLAASQLKQQQDNQDKRSASQKASAQVEKPQVEG